jgi:hypothetical protein
MEKRAMDVRGDGKAQELLRRQIGGVEEGWKGEWVGGRRRELSI